MGDSDKRRYLRPHDFAWDRALPMFIAAIGLVVATACSGGDGDSGKLTRDVSQELLQANFDAIGPRDFLMQPCVLGSGSPLSWIPFRDLSRPDAEGLLAGLIEAGFVETGRVSTINVLDINSVEVTLSPKGMGVLAVEGVLGSGRFSLAMCDGGTVHQVTGIQQLPELNAAEVLYEWTPSVYDELVDLIAPYSSINLRGLDEVVCKDNAVFVRFDDGWRIDAGNYTPACQSESNTDFGQDVDAAPTSLADQPEPTAGTAPDATTTTTTAVEASPGSASGMIAYSVDSFGNTDLFLTAEGGTPERIVASQGKDTQPDFSPDGTQIVYATDRSGNWDVWLKDLSTGDDRQLTNGSGTEWNPEFHPNGDQIVFSADGVISVIDPDGSGERALVEFSGASSPSWSPDGAEIAYITFSQEDNTDIRVLTVGTGGVRTILDGWDLGFVLDWSRSGIIAQGRSEGSTDGFHVFVVAPSGEVVNEFSTGPHTAKWDRGSDRLVFVVNDNIGQANWPATEIHVVIEDSEKLGSPASYHGSAGATSFGRYVALGDSFSSGEGAVGEFQDHTDTDIFDKGKNECHRSFSAYPTIVATNWMQNSTVDHWACSGALIEDMRTERAVSDGPPYTDPGIENQSYLERLGGDVTLVTITIGGNDIFFGAIIECLVAEAIAEEWNGVNCESLKAGTEQRIRELDGKLSDLYQEIRDPIAAEGRVLVLAYPRLFPKPGEGGLPLLCGVNETGSLTFDDRAWANDIARQLNKVIRENTERIPGVEFVETEEALAGGVLCQIDPDAPQYFNPLVFQDLSNSFHPKPSGHAILAETVLQHLRGTGR